MINCARRRERSAPPERELLRYTDPARMPSLEDFHTWIGGACVATCLASASCGGTASTEPDRDASDEGIVSSDASTNQEASEGEGAVSVDSAADIAIPTDVANANPTCEEAGDCHIGLVCCASVDPTSSEFQAMCAANCPDTGSGLKALAQVCKSDSECQNGKSCLAQTCNGQALNLLWIGRRESVRLPSGSVARDPSRLLDRD
jgi:hypothetical protein